jgi:hypothetical protein
MAIIQSGASDSVIVNIGEAAAKGLHNIAKPQDYGTLGHYAVSVQTGSIGAGSAANSELLQLRWTDSTRVCVITEIVCNGMVAFTAFAAGSITLNATICRSWSGDGSGGTPITLTGDTNQLRASMGASLMGSARVSTTAALTAGTKTIDSQPIGMITSHSSGGVASATPIIGSIYLPTPQLYKCDIASGEHPITLVQNEGLIIRSTVPATGVWVAGFTIKWMELSAF